MTHEPSHAAREQTATQQAAHAEGVAAQRAWEYPNPYAERLATPQREPQSQGYVAPSAKSLAEAEARDREIVGRDRSGPPPLGGPRPMNPYEEYERRWGDQDHERER